MVSPFPPVNHGPPPPLRSTTEETTDSDEVSVTSSLSSLGRLLPCVRQVLLYEKKRHPSIDAAESNPPSIPGTERKRPAESTPVTSRSSEGAEKRQPAAGPPFEVKTVFLQQCTDRSVRLLEVRLRCREPRAPGAAGVGLSRQKRFLPTINTYRERH